jgi:hypothetical protein
VLLGITPNIVSDTLADSLVLSLAYAGYYGDTATPVRVHIYKLTEEMQLDSAYYSNRAFMTDLVDLEGTGNPYAIYPTTPVVVGSDTNAAPQLRIRLSDALKDSIFAKKGQPELANNDNWKAYFKGIHVVTDQVSSGGSLLYFSPTSIYSKMTVYYHDSTGIKFYSFSLSGGARVNHTSHDYSGSLAEIQLASPGTQFDVNYLQPLAGMKTIISFPHLKLFKEAGSILINKAELVVTVPENTSTTVTPTPDNILVLAKNSSGTYDFPLDYYERFYGGAYSISARTYTFGITRTIQRILDGTITDYGYSLNILGSMIAGNSAIIGSGKPGDSQMKLKIHYTKLH